MSTDPASRRHFLSTGAMGLGYLDGARVDVRVARAHRLALAGGFVPSAERLRFSTDVTRLGASWGFGAGGALEGIRALFGEPGRRPCQDRRPYRQWRTEPQPSSVDRHT